MNIKNKKLLIALLLGASCNMFSRGIVREIVRGSLNVADAAVDTALVPVDAVTGYEPDYYDDGYYVEGYRRGRRGKDRRRTSAPRRSFSSKK